MVRVGDGDRHRVVFGTRSGQPVGECDCKGYRHHEWCADLDADPGEELAMLWRQYRQGGKA